MSGLWEGYGEVFSGNVIGKVYLNGCFIVMVIGIWFINICCFIFIMLIDI